jgi:hypothetical protein
MCSQLHSLHQINMSIRAHFTSYNFFHLNQIRPHLSGGADDQVLKYDLTRYNTNRQEDDGPTEAYDQHSVSFDLAYECRSLKVRVGLYPEHILSSVSGRSLYERKVGTRRHLCLNSVYNMPQRRWPRHAS